MSRKVIPETIELYCDRCGDRLWSNSNYKHKMLLTYTCNMSNIMWEYSPIPPQTVELCDNCFNLFIEFVNK